MGENCNSNNVIHGINCTVSDCVHNCDKKCTAGEINVGPQNASTTSETDCQTFKLR